MTVSEILSYIDSFAPFSTQEKWDNSGLLVGDINCEVSKALVCLDVTDAEIEYAKNCGAQLIISHHPVIFRPCSQVLCDSVLYSNYIKLLHDI